MFTMRFKTDNAAFTDDERAEVARILRTVAGHIEEGHQERAIMDINGNKVGAWELR